MDFETLFSIAGLIAMFGWLCLLFSPLIPKWADWIAGLVLPIILSLGYVTLLITPSSDSAGGFGTLADVMVLFSNEQAALAGWIHFLAFDLFIGAWVCRTARAEGVSFWLVAPCLPVIFLFGPAGLLAFQVVRAVRNRTIKASISA
ncbi:ABA4-like family protein [Yoonia sp. R2331]|uniref:ABA4-like family protein n=1 Tax=Yoonia sp. R2331 TaxID=3237238 RepID=UPI0034E3B991